MARDDRRKKRNRREAPAERSGVRRRIYRVLEAGHIYNWKVLAFESFLIALILANVVAVMLESVSSLHDAYHVQFEWFEYVSVTIFAVEYSLRIWTSIEDPRH